MPALRRYCRKPACLLCTCRDLGILPRLKKPGNSAHLPVRYVPCGQSPSGVEIAFGQTEFQYQQTKLPYPGRVSEAYVNTSCRSLRIRQVTCCTTSGLLPETRRSWPGPSPLHVCSRLFFSFLCLFQCVAHGGVVLEPRIPVRLELGCNIMQQTSCSLSIGSGYLKSSPHLHAG